ncbi:MAG: hypothetical protein R3B70_31445 [Polyangiaceae bacterium]
MRWDMFEVIIERPRKAPWGGERKGRRGETTERAFDRAPSRLGMKRAGRGKFLNENLAPLRRFLHRRVGRPWSRVRSEMCAVLSMSSAVQKHVMDHVRQMVEENPRMIDGVPYDPVASGGQYRALSSYGSWRQFYVCPRTGMLRMAPPIKRRARASEKASEGAVG